jgi:acyl-CoA oxidase
LLLSLPPFTFQHSNIFHMPPHTALDLRNARSQASFSPGALQLLLVGSAERMEKKRKVVEVLSNNPVFDKTSRNYLSRSEQLERGLRVTRELFRVKEEEKFDDEEFAIALIALDEMLGTSLLYLSLLLSFR